MAGPSASQAMSTALPRSAIIDPTLWCGVHLAAEPVAVGMEHAIRPGRLEDAAAILAVQALGWETTYRGLLPPHVFPQAGNQGGIAFWQRTLLDGKTATRVAADADGRVLGFVSGGLRRGLDLPADSEIYALYIHPDAQGGGLGRRLVNTFSRVLRARGGRELGLWVLAGNTRAQAFYAHLGGEPKRRQVSRENGVDFDEIAYVWSPIERASM